MVMQNFEKDEKIKRVQNSLLLRLMNFTQIVSEKTKYLKKIYDSPCTVFTEDANRFR